MEEDYFTGSVKSTFRPARRGYVDLSHIEAAQILRDGPRVPLGFEHLPGVVQHSLLEFVSQAIGQRRSHHPDVRPC